jgi:hypothetical protein
LKNIEMEKLIVKVHLSSQRLLTVLTAIVLLNLCMLGGTWLFSIYFREDLSGNWEAGSAVKYLLVQFNLAGENVTAVWYSSMLLLLIAVMSALCFIADWQRFHDWRDRYLSYGWLLFTLIFTMLSLDEIGSLHENIGMLTALNPFGDYALGWVFLLGIPIGLVGLLMLVFSWVHIRRSPWALTFAILGIMLFISNPFQEHIEIKMWSSVPDPISWQRPIIFILLEEGTEIFGSVCLLIATTIYAIFATRKSTTSPLASQIDIECYLKRKTAIVSTIVFACFFCLLIAIVHLTLKDVAGGDRGIAKNWFPSSFAFLVFLISIYIFSSIRRYKENRGKSYLILAIFSLLLSMYYGSSNYAYFLWGDRSLPGKAIHTILLTVAIATGIKLILQVKDWWSRLGIVTWLLFLGAALSVGKIYSAELTFIGFASLLIALLAHVYRWQFPPTSSLDEGGY